MRPSAAARQAISVNGRSVFSLENEPRFPLTTPNGIRHTSPLCPILLLGSQCSWY